MVSKHFQSEGQVGRASHQGHLAGLVGRVGQQDQLARPVVGDSQQGQSAGTVSVYTTLGLRGGDWKYVNVALSRI